MFEAILGSGMLINGLLNAVTGSVNAAKGREMQERGMELQRELQDRQWARTSALQREMREASARDAAATQERALAHQRKMVQEQSFLAAWPLSQPPHALLDMLDNGDGSTVPTLHIMVADPVVQRGNAGTMPAVMQNAVDDVVRMMCRFYSEQAGERPVRVYTKIQKQGVALGTSQVQAVYSVFRGVPTIILQPVQTPDSSFRLDCAFWGIGSTTVPSFVEIFKCNLDEVSDGLLEDLAREYKALQADGALDSAKHNDLAALLEEKGQKERLCAERGYSSRQRELVMEDVGRKLRALAAKSFLSELNVLVQKLIAAAYKLNMAMLADSHFLLEYNVPPLFPQLCSAELAELPALVEHADRFFSQAIDSCLGEAGDTRPVLMEAEMAHAYHAAGNGMLARQHFSRGVSRFGKLAGKGGQAGAPWLVNSDLCCGARILDNLATHYGEQFLPEAERSMLYMDPQDLNRLGAETYKSGDAAGAAALWRRAADMGEAPAANNVAQLYLAGLGVAKDAETACRYFAQAVEGGVPGAFRHACRTANVFLHAGDWSRAFLHYTRYLQSADTGQRDMVLVQSAVLMLTDLRDSVPQGLQKEWLAEAVRSVRGLGGMPSAPAVAAGLLQEKAECGVAAALDSLAVAWLKMCGHSVPLFAGVQDVAALDWGLDQAAMECLGAYAREAVRAGTPRSSEISQLVQ